MKKSHLLARTAVGAVATLALASAHGQSTYDWTGFYAGGSLGAMAFDSEIDDYWCFMACDAPSSTELEFSAALQGGYNWQVGDNFVVGVEADIGTGAEANDTVRFNPESGVRWNNEWNWLMTFRGRAGLNVNRTMIYVTGGLAVADGDFSAEEFGPNESDDYFARNSSTLTGLVGGVGIEHAVTDRLRVKAEVMTLSMPDEQDCWRRRNQTDGACVRNEGASDDFVQWRTSATNVRLGLNWVF